MRLAGNRRRHGLRRRQPRTRGPAMRRLQTSRRPAPSTPHAWSGDAAIADFTASSAVNSARIVQRRGDCRLHGVQLPPGRPRWLSARKGRTGPGTRGCPQWWRSTQISEEPGRGTDSIAAPRLRRALVRIHHGCSCNALESAHGRELPPGHSGRRLPRRRSRENSLTLLDQGRGNPFRKRYVFG